MSVDGGSDQADLYDSTLSGNDTFTGHTSAAVGGNMVYAAGNSTTAYNFEYGYARVPVDYSDTDTAHLYSGTLWSAIGDWETVINDPNPGARGSTNLNLDFAHWLAALEHAKTASNDDGAAEALDQQVVDSLFAQGWE